MGLGALISGLDAPSVNRVNVEPTCPSGRILLLIEVDIFALPKPGTLYEVVQRPHGKICDTNDVDQFRRMGDVLHRGRDGCVDVGDGVGEDSTFEGGVTVCEKAIDERGSKFALQRTESFTIFDFTNSAVAAASAT